MLYSIFMSFQQSTEDLLQQCRIFVNGLQSSVPRRAREGQPPGIEVRKGDVGLVAAVIVHLPFLFEFNYFRYFISYRNRMGNA